MSSFQFMLKEILNYVAVDIIKDGGWEISRLQASDNTGPSLT